MNWYDEYCDYRDTCLKVGIDYICYEAFVTKYDYPEQWHFLTVEEE